MRRLLGLLLLLLVLFPSPTLAQDPPPRIGPFVVDLHASLPRFPNDVLQLAESRGFDTTAVLPGRGFGLQVGAHFYVLRVKVISFGLGAEFATVQASQKPVTSSTGSTGSTVPATEEHFSTFAPELSFNFGNGHGWSYLSGGLGTSTWALVATGQPKGPADEERLQTLNYGAGARWFAKSHLAFSLDLRVYVISPGTPFIAGKLGSPRMSLFVIGAGISVK
jgi:hypothetical protein